MELRALHLSNKLGNIKMVEGTSTEDFIKKVKELMAQLLSIGDIVPDTKVRLELCLKAMVLLCRQCYAKMNFPVLKSFVANYSWKRREGRIMFFKMKL